MVIALHGGPAAAGSAAPIARGLADAFRVYEPWQRGSGPVPLTVQTHVDDLGTLIEALGLESPPAIAGWSWGAMLALAFAADCPDQAGPLVLVGCGTFDKKARARMHGILDSRIDPDLRRGLDEVERETADPAERMEKKYELMHGLYNYAAVEDPADDLPEPLDMKAHQETWDDMIRLQEEEVYPAAFSAVRPPVLMVHGDYDPHPGRMIRESLEPFVQRLQYHELQNCGHSPWNERHARAEFFELVKSWLAKNMTV